LIGERQGPGNRHEMTEEATWRPAQKFGLNFRKIHLTNWIASCQGRLFPAPPICIKLASLTHPSNSPSQHPTHPSSTMSQASISILSRKRRSTGIHTVAIAAAVLMGLAGSVLAQIETFIIVHPTPSPSVHPHTPVNLRTETALNALIDNRRPDSPSNILQNAVTDRIVDRLTELQSNGATAGVDDKGGKEVAPPPALIGNFSANGEYSYLTSHDNRTLGTDSINNTGTGGGDFTIGKTLVGLMYMYSHGSEESGALQYNGDSDSNYIMIYAAQPVTSFFSVGVASGYGHTESLTTQFAPFSVEGSRENTWLTSPFATLSYKQGNFYSSFTTTFQYAHIEEFCTDQLNFVIKAGYRFTEWFKGEISGKYIQTLHDTSGGLNNAGSGLPGGLPVGLPNGGQFEEDHWFSVGVKFTQNITPKFELYEAYQLNINDTFTQHMITGGVTYNF